MLKNRGVVENLSYSSARYIKENGGHPDVSLSKLHFSLQLWISLIMIVLLSTGISLLLGTTQLTLLSLLSICVLRYFSGGWHFRSMDACVIFTVAVVILIPLIPVLDFIWLIIMNGVSLLLVLMLAPTGHGQKFSSNSQRVIFKIISICIVILSIVLMKQILTISFFTQAVTLITLKEGR